LVAIEIEADIRSGIALKTEDAEGRRLCMAAFVACVELLPASSSSQPPHLNLAF
jgi:hypothetical protein